MGAQLPFSVGLFVCQPTAIMCHVLGIVYLIIATHLIKKADFTKMTAQTSAVKEKSNPEPTNLLPSVLSPFQAELFS